MSAVEPVAGAPGARLEHFPISFFGMSMGVLGLALALRAAGFEASALAVAGLGAVLLVLLLATLGLKGVRHGPALAAEWQHPVRLAFFPATSISVLLLAAFLREPAPGAAMALWVLGAATQGVLTLAVISSWIGHRAFGQGHLSPAWFIPAVGNVVVPLAGIPLGQVELSWTFFSAGLVFWLVLLTLVFNRLVFHDPMPARLQPTLVILIAPPAVAFLSWVQFHGGEIDATARILINIGYFFLALVALQLPRILRLPFALSFWALSFPLAAITVASFRFAALTGSGFHHALGLVLLGALVITIGALAVRTVRAALAGEICVPE